MSECEHEPPVDRTRGYAILKRRGPQGERHELRVGLDEYDGKPFASLRLWCESHKGGMWPSPRVGCTVRKHELIEVINALASIARTLGELPPDEDDDAGRTVLAPKPPPELPAHKWLHYGGTGGRDAKPDARVDHVGLYAGQGRRRVDLSEACRSAAFEMLLPKREDD